MRHVLILGGASAIANGAARAFAADGDKIFLVDMNEEKLAISAQDLKVRGAADVATRVADLSDVTEHHDIIHRAEKAMGKLDTVLLAYGTLSKQDDCETDVATMLKELQINFTSAASLLTIIGNRLEELGHGQIGVISSVAGDRGRASNYVYGSAKGGLTVFLSGLRCRLAAKGVSVTTIKPGFVDSPMTDGLPKGGLLWTPAEAVGKATYSAITKGKATVYLPWFWRFIMLIIKNLPEFIFGKLKI
jgi:decaprenylphospho-beta-D-erythro-pentofuranosid-2-ulose 2-reductase